MSATPRVSIGLPVYNGGRLLELTLENLLAQTFDDFELIISDNASTDDTETLCRAFAARDPRIRYHRQATNVGANPNYNAVRRLGRAAYFKWASANDLCEPSFLEECVAVLDARPDVALAYSETTLIGEDGALVGHYDDPLDAAGDDPAQRFIDVLYDMRMNNAFNGVFRADGLARAGEIRRYFGSDLPLMAAVALTGRLHRIPVQLFHRRVGPNSYTTERLAKGAAHEYGYDEANVVAKQLGDYLRIILSAPMPVKRRMRLLRALVRQSYSLRRRLGGELLMPFRRLIQDAKRQRA
jgi:glycosyltransferase involved in cell wall biosynthesis